MESVAASMVPGGKHQVMVVITFHTDDAPRPRVLLLRPCEWQSEDVFGLAVNLADGPSSGIALQLPFL